MTRQVFWYNLFHTPVPYLFHTLWNKGSVPYPMEQEGARCSPETRGFDAHPHRAADRAEASSKDAAEQS